MVGELFAVVRTKAKKKKNDRNERVGTLTVTLLEDGIARQELEARVEKNEVLEDSLKVCRRQDVGVGLL